MTAQPEASAERDCKSCRQEKMIEISPGFWKCPHCDTACPKGRYRGCKACKNCSISK